MVCRDLHAGNHSWILIDLFGPVPRYKLQNLPREALDSHEFINQLEALAGSRSFAHTQVDALPNGTNFYEAELQAIGQASKSINWEAYIFAKGDFSLWHTATMMAVQCQTSTKGKLPLGEMPQYKVWIRLDRLWFTSSLALVSLVGVGLSVLSPWFLLFVIPFCVFLYISVIVGSALIGFRQWAGTSRDGFMSW